MPAPKDPKKYEEWKRKLSKASKGRKTWNTGIKYSEDPSFDEYREKLSKVRKGKKKKPVSEETKAKISASLKGKRKGIKPTEEHRKKLSLAAKGKPKSEAHKKALSVSKLGTKASLETRQKMSEVRKGKPGTPHTKETRLKISRVLRAKRLKRPERSFGTGSKHSSEAKAKMSLMRKGKIVSEETKRKMSQAATGKVHNYYSPGFAGKLHSDVTKNKISSSLKEGISSGRIVLTVNPTLYLTGFHDSEKAGRVRYRSSWELQVFKNLDNDKNVRTYKVESLSVPYEYQGVTRNYFPDIIIYYTDGSQKVIEVKPKGLLDNPINQAKFKAAKALFGDRFEIWTEEQCLNL